MRAVALAFALWLAAPAAALAAWEPAKPVSQAAAPAGVGIQADITVGANGLATAFFMKAEGNQPFLTRRASGASSWSSSQGLAPSATAPSFDANLAANAAGDALGIWRFSDNFTPPQTVSWPADADGPHGLGAVGTPQPQAFANAPLVAIDDAGNGYAVSQTGGKVLFYRFDAATQSWSGPTEVGKGGTDAQLAVNGRGDVAVSYTRQPSFNATAPDTSFIDREVFAARKPAGAEASSLSDERKFDFPDNGVLAHALAIGPDGAITVVFSEDTAGTIEATQIFARRWPAGAEPDGNDKVEVLSSPRPAHQPASSPKVVVDSDGRVTAAWLEETADSLTQLYAAERVDDRGFGSRDRISPSYQQFVDDESSEPPDGVSPGNERPVTSFDLAVDAEGTATIVYSDSADGIGQVDADVKAARRATGGRWTAPVSLRSTDSKAGPVVFPRPERVAAGRARQTDVAFFQQFDGKKQLMATRFEGPPPPSGVHQAMVTSRDVDGNETEILVQWCPAAGLKPGEEAPTILVGAGWGYPGDRCPPGNTPEEQLEGVFSNTPIKSFIDAGYNVMTFDARGFWRSGGTVQVDDPRYEGRDMQALIDYIANQREAQLDGPDDPRLGMAGGSYGGGIQLVTAALDHRVDAIAPSIAWNSLVTSLFKYESLKAGWAAILFGAGVPTTTLPGVVSPAGIQTGIDRMAPQIRDTFEMGATSGTIDQETRDWYAAHGPDSLLDRINAPTLLIQGTVDTLFTLDEAHRNFEALKAAGTEVKMLWFCGGHGACERHGEDQEHINTRVLAWFDRYLRRRDISTGPTFEWVDEDGGWHESASYPPRSDSVLRATGSGTLSLTPGEQPGSGGVIFATPYSFRSDHPAAVDVQIKAPAETTTVLGAPQLRLTYTATGVTTYGTGVEGAAEDRTYVYAQIVDNTRNRVVGNQATPIPITLDGEEHELSLPLERIASRSPKGGYSLQIVPQTSVYDGQRAAGLVNFRSIEITLPLDLPGLTAATGGRPTGAQTRKRRTRALRCHGLKATITGTRRRDVIRGSARRDVIVARRGKDVIRSRGGRDVVCAGKGNDRAFGGKGADRLFGGVGADRLTGGAGRDRLAGGAGRDILRGDPLRDRLLGGPGRDRILRVL